MLIDASDRMQLQEKLNACHRDGVDDLHMMTRSLLAVAHAACSSDSDRCDCCIKIVAGLT